MSVTRLIFSIFCVCFVTSFVEFASTQSAEGDKCLIDAAKNITGECKLIEKCPSIYNDPEKHKKPPKFCGFINSSPIVCCKEGDEISNRMPTTIPTTVPSKVAAPTAAPIQPLNIRSDAPYCEQYSEFAYENIRIPGGSNVIKENRCFMKKNDSFNGKKTAEVKEFPHMALIGGDDKGEAKYFCAGVLVSDLFVLTSAHCIKDSGAKYVKLTGNLQPDYFTIAQNIPYPRYSNVSFYNDIGLIKLNRPVALNPYARPACLPLRSTNLDTAVNTFVSSTWEGVGDGTQFVKVRLSKIDKSACDPVYKGVTKLPQGIDYQSQICAQSTGNEAGVCQINLGGPLQMIHPSEHCSYVILGISSFAKNCGFSQAPVVYTDIRPYVDWIETTVWSR